MIATATNKVAGLPIPVGTFPFWVAITPDGTQAYVTNADNTVSVIKTANRAVVATVTVDSPAAVAVSPNGQEVYVGKQEGTNKVRVIATATNRVVGLPIPVGNYCL